MIALMAALAVAQGPVTPVAPIHYRIDAQTSTEQDLTSVGKGKPTGSLATTAFITVTFSDSADGQVAQLKVDSMTLVPAGAMLASLSLPAAHAAADSVRGEFVRTYVVRGAVRGQPRGSSQNPALQTLFQAVSVLFPGLRSNLKVGEGWADTTANNGDTQGGHQSGRVIATWKVTGMENGGFVLEGTATTNVTTTRTNGQTLHIVGSSEEHLVMAVRGPTVSASIKASNDVSMTSSQGTTPIPSRSAGTLKLTRLP